MTIRQLDPDVDRENQRDGQRQRDLSAGETDSFLRERGLLFAGRLIHS